MTTTTYVNPVQPWQPWQPRPWDPSPVILPGQEDLRLQNLLMLQAELMELKQQLLQLQAEFKELREMYGNMVDALRELLDVKRNDQFSNAFEKRW